MRDATRLVTALNGSPVPGSSIDVLLDALALWARTQRAQWLWLEVRTSNARAQQVYLRYGYRRVGERKHYYPADPGREDAIVMSYKL